MKTPVLCALALVSVSALAAGLVKLDDTWDYSDPDSVADDADQGLVAPGATDYAAPAPGGLVSLIGGIGFRIYHVDYASGNDNNAGTTPAQPWKHAPGDPAATGQPARIALVPGDIVRFKGGVRYRGTITFKYSGATGRPITYTGEGYGNEPAIIDGADPVLGTTPCPSKAACGNAANWKNLLLVTYSAPPTANLRFYDKLGPLYEAQTPHPADPFWFDSTDEYQQIPSTQYAAVVSGTVKDATLAAAARTASNPRLLLWRTGNQIAEQPILSASGSTIRFDAGGYTPYADKIRVAVLGAVSAVDTPGSFATLGAGKAIVYPRVGGGALSVGNGRRGIDVYGRSNVGITGFIFEHGTGAVATDGVAITNRGVALSNLTVENNQFRDYSLRNGAAVVKLRLVSGLSIRGNVIRDIHGGSGINLGITSNVLVENNQIDRVGRTGMAFLGSHGGVVRGNILSDIRSAHGNGLSTYLDNRNVEVSDNCIFNTTRPITFHGNYDPGTVNNLTFRRNLLVTDDKGRAAIYSWGKNTNGVLLENNIALSPRRGMILSGNDTNVTVRNNETNGIGFYPTTPTRLTLQNNSEALDLLVARNWQLNASACQAQAGRTQLAVVARG